MNNEKIVTFNFPEPIVTEMKILNQVSWKNVMINSINNTLSDQSYPPLYEEFLRDGNFLSRFGGRIPILGKLVFGNKTIKADVSLPGPLVNKMLDKKDSLSWTEVVLNGVLNEMYKLNKKPDTQTMPFNQQNSPLNFDNFLLNNFGNSAELNSDFQDSLIRISNDYQTQDQIRQNISTISIPEYSFNTKRLSDYYTDVFKTTDSILKQSSNILGQDAQPILNEPSVHNLFTNFIIINNLTTIDSKILRTFFEKIFFESSVSRGGKNRSGEYPASIKVPILYNDKYFWLRGAKAIDLNKKFPSFTVFSKQVVGSQEFNFSNFQILYLDKVKRIVEGELKHSRIKSEDLAGLFELSRDSSLGLPFKTKFQRINFSIGKVTIYKGIITQDNFKNVLNYVFAVNEFFLTHPSIIIFFKEKFKIYLLNRRTEGGKTMGMAAKWQNYYNKKTSNLESDELSAMNTVQTILANVNISEYFFENFNQGLFINTKKMAKTDFSAPQETDSQDLKFNKHTYDLNSIFNYTFKVLEDSNRTNESKRDLAHSYVSGLLGLNKSELSELLKGKRAILTSNQQIIIRKEVKQLIKENLPQVKVRLESIFNQLLNFLTNCKFVTTVCVANDYYKMREIVSNKFKKLLINDFTEFSEINLDMEKFESAKTALRNNKSNGKLSKSNEKTIDEIFRSSIVLLAGENSKDNFNLETANEGSYTFIFRNFIRPNSNLSNLHIDSELSRILNYTESDDIAAGRIPTSTFDEIIDQDLIHEIKRVNVIKSSNKVKIVMGKSDTSQITQRESVGLINFSYFSIMKINQVYYFIQIFVKNN